MTPDNAIRELLLAVAGNVPVIFADESGPRPDKPYIQLRIGNARPFPVCRGDVDEAGLQVVSAHRDAGVELQCFGKGSFHALDCLVLRLGMADGMAKSEALRLAVFDVGEIRSIPVLRGGTTYEPRAIVELGIRYAVALTDEVGVIERIGARGEMRGGRAGAPEIAVNGG
ncbi:LIC_12616 family protein [Cupriavidus sp. D384]|uniref:phage neck terminator protein n=1 Tax=Cupriavidus sp. D384 TaxID=1538095 RepID=UPI00082E7835|nr:hypothetical protein [Cupriavidus sp. D384]